MENISKNEREASKATFSRVDVIQPNKIKKYMAVCKNCGLVVAENEADQHQHWKHSCAHKLSFRYVYPKNASEKIKVECLVCHEQFGDATIHFMAAHRFGCKIQSHSVNSSQATESVLKPIQQDNAGGSSPATPKTYPASKATAANIVKPATATTSKSDWNELGFDKFRFVLGGNKFHYGVQCRFCKEVFIMDTLKLLQHRTECKADNPLQPNESNSTDSDEDEDEVLIAVQTVHIPIERATQSTSGTTDTSAASASSNYCFVCNTPKNELFVKLFGTKSTHSKKAIYDFIWKFMGSKPSVRNGTADASNLSEEVICNDCFEMVCNYDAARSTAKRLKKQIRQKLAITETYFEQTANATVTPPNEADDGEQSDVTMMEETVCDVIDLCDDD